jgi:hypothetical protein
MDPYFGATRPIIKVIKVVEVMPCVMIREKHNTRKNCTGTQTQPQ